MTSPPTPEPLEPPAAARAGAAGAEQPRATFRPGGVRVLAVAWWVLAALLAGDLVLRGGPTSQVLGLPLLALSCAVVHAFFWYPAVVVDDDGVELVNVARTVRLPWSSVEDLDTRWALTLTAADRSWQSWAAPASGRRVRPVQRRETPWAEPGAEGIAGSRAPGSSAGEAAVLVGTWLQTWRDRPAAQRSAGGAPQVRWNLPVLAAVGGTALLAVSGAAWTLLG